MLKQLYVKNFTLIDERIEFLLRDDDDRFTSLVGDDLRLTSGYFVESFVEVTSEFGRGLNFWHFHTI